METFSYILLKKIKYYIYIYMIKTIFIILFVIIILIIILKSVNKFTKKERFGDTKTYKITKNSNIKHALFISGFTNDSTTDDKNDIELLNFNYINVITYLESFLNVYFPQLSNDYIRQFLTIENFLFSDSFRQIITLIEEDIQIGDVLPENIVNRYKIRNGITLLYKYYNNNKNRQLLLTDGSTNNYESNMKQAELNNILNKCNRLNDINEELKKFSDFDTTIDFEVFNFNLVDMIKYNITETEENCSIIRDIDTTEVQIKKIDNLIKICNNIMSLGHIKNNTTREQALLNMIGMLILHKFKDELTGTTTEYHYNFINETLFISKGVSTTTATIGELKTFNIGSIQSGVKYDIFEITDIYYDNIYDVTTGTVTDLPDEFNKFLNTLNSEYINYIKLIDPFINDEFEKLLLNIYNNRICMYDFYVFLLNMSEIGKISVHYKERDEAGFGNLRQRLNNLINPDSVTTTNVTTSKSSDALELTNQFCNNFYDNELNGCNYYIDKDIGELTNDDIERIENCLIMKRDIENMPYKAIKLDAIMQKINAFFIIMDIIDIIVILVTLGGGTGLVIARKAATEAGEEIMEQSLKQIIKAAIKPAFTKTFKNVTKKGFWKGLYNFGKGIFQFTLYVMFLASKLFEGIMVVASGGLLAPLIWGGGGATKIINEIADKAINKAIHNLGVKAFSELSEEGKQRLIRKIAQDIARKSMWKITSEGAGSIKVLLGATGDIQKQIQKTVNEKLGSVFDAKLIVSNSIKELAVKGGSKLLAKENPKLLTKEGSELLDDLVVRVLLENGAVVNKTIDGEEKLILKNGDEFDMDIESSIKIDLIESAGKVVDPKDLPSSNLIQEFKDTVKMVSEKMTDPQGFKKELEEASKKFVKKVENTFKGNINDEVISVNRKIDEIGGEGFNAKKDVLRTRTANLAKLSDSSDEISNEILNSVMIDFHTQSFLAKYGSSVSDGNIDELMEQYFKDVSQKSALDSEIDTLFFYDSSVYKQDFSNALAKAAKESDIEDEGINFFEFHLEMRKIAMHYMMNPKGGKMLPITEENFKKVYLMLFKQLSGSDDSARSNLIRIFGTDTITDVDSFMKQLIEQDFDEFFPVLVKEGDDYVPNADDFIFPELNEVDVDDYLAQYIDPQDAINRYSEPPPNPQQSAYDELPGPRYFDPNPQGLYDDLPGSGYFDPNPQGLYDDLPGSGYMEVGDDFTRFVEPNYFEPAATTPRKGNDTYMELDSVIKEPEYLKIFPEPEYLVVFPHTKTVDMSSKLNELLSQLKTRPNDINNEQFILNFFKNSGLSENEIKTLQRFMIDGDVADIPIRVRQQALEIRRYISIIPLRATGGVVQTSSSRVVTFFNTLLTQMKNKVKRGSVDL